tara:strand:- start:45358 stop:46485 length:1128 start_codon:yes stop_codon:yes gene_type:complete
VLFLQILIYIGGPYFFLRFKDHKAIDTLSPVVCCYVLGVFLGNLPFLNLNSSLANEFAEISVPLAIPLLLLSTDLIKWSRLARKTVLSFVFILLSVMLVSFVTSFFFKDIIADHWKVAGMLVGVYTGGTPNMTAIGKSLEVTNEVFLLMNGADLILGGLYLLFILSIGHRLMGKVLIPFKKGKGESDEYELDEEFLKLNLLPKIKRIFLFLGIALLALGISAGLAFLFLGSLHPAVIILGITTIGIGISFKKSIRELKGSYEVGEFLLLIFCVAVGSMANIQNLANSSMDYLLFAGIVMIGSIILHLILCIIFKIDKDTAIITSVAGVFGPPFVAPMAEALGNREIIISGLTSGLVGYALGNYLGIGLAYLVQSF